MYSPVYMYNLYIVHACEYTYPVDIPGYMYTVRIYIYSLFVYRYMYYSACMRLCTSCGYVRYIYMFYAYINICTLLCIFIVWTSCMRVDIHFTVHVLCVCIYSAYLYQNIYYTRKAKSIQMFPMSCSVGGFQKKKKKCDTCHA